MKQITLIAIAVAFCTLLTTSAHSKESLYFGIVDNHRPHVYLDKEEHPAGSLVYAIKELCKKLSAECNLLNGSLFNLLDELVSTQINALVVTDAVLLPAVDEIIFTPPLCKVSPVFIYKVTEGEAAFKSIDEIKNVTIGVHLDSGFHLYLLDNYYSHSRIKPYSLLESGIFDLAHDRIDALLAERSFFEAQVGTTTLTSKKKKYYLDTLPAEHIKLPYTTMSLALRAKDTDLYQRLTKLINSQGQTKSCVELVNQALKNDNIIESHSDLLDSLPPAQGNKAK